MSTESNNASVLEQILAYAALTIIGVAVVSFFATLIAALSGVDQSVLTDGFWPFITWLGYVGLPIGFVLIITLIIITRRRRKREFLDEQR